MSYRIRFVCPETRISAAHIARRPDIGLAAKGLLLLIAQNACGGGQHLDITHLVDEFGADDVATAIQDLIRVQVLFLQVFE